MRNSGFCCRELPAVLLHLAIAACVYFDHLLLARAAFGRNPNGHRPQSVLCSDLSGALTPDRGEKRAVLEVRRAVVMAGAKHALIDVDVVALDAFGGEPNPWTEEDVAIGVVSDRFFC